MGVFDMPKIRSGCPGFKKFWNPEDSDCQSCKEKFSNEYLACVRACGGKVVSKGTSKSKVLGKPTSDRTRNMRLTVEVLDSGEWFTMPDLIAAVQTKRVEQALPGSPLMYVKRGVRYLVQAGVLLGVVERDGNRYRKLSV